ncbi:hypothetical protein SLAVM298S_01354 [Streptomyces lavendulae subsp. lavendulae]
MPRVSAYGPGRVRGPPTRGRCRYTVVVAGEWGVVEDITLTFLRDKAEEILHNSKEWDGRGWDLAVTETTPSTIVVRVIVTAKGPDDLWTVCCAVREQLGAWLAEKHPGCPAPHPAGSGSGSGTRSGRPWSLRSRPRPAGGAGGAGHSSCARARRRRSRNAWRAAFGTQAGRAEDTHPDPARRRGGARRGRRRPRLALVVGPRRPVAAARPGGLVRRPATPAFRPAQLPPARAPPVRPGGAAAGDPAVLHRAERRRPPLRPRHPQYRLRAGQGHRRRGAVRHRARPPPARQRISHPLHGPTSRYGPTRPGYGSAGPTAQSRTTWPCSTSRR